MASSLALASQYALALCLWVSLLPPSRYLRRCSMWCERKRSWTRKRRNSKVPRLKVSVWRWTVGNGNQEVQVWHWEHGKVKMRGGLLWIYAISILNLSSRWSSCWSSGTSSGSARMWFTFGSENPDRIWWTLSPHREIIFVLFMPVVSLVSLAVDIIKLLSVLFEGIKDHMKDLESEPYHRTSDWPSNGSSSTLSLSTKSSPRNKLVLGDRNRSSCCNYNRQGSEQNSANYST